MNRNKIYCEELMRDDFDEFYGTNEGTNDLRDNVVGFIDINESGKWDVTMLQEDTWYETASQDNAEIIANQEMIKALLMK
ncbi:MAG: hypothetical protein D4S01_06355 [Dehalococcoidia bacterium]|nr:MAG: hypothetical protein D4S01_06355 [Dehalococcoidia bacterium]